MNFGEGASLVDYRKAWSKCLHSAPKRTDYPESVAASLGLSIDKARAANPVAYDALCRFAWLAPDSIPRKELLVAGASELPEPLHQAVEEDELWNGLVDTLNGISLLDRLERGYYAIHRVTQQVLRQRQMAEGAADRWRAVANCVRKYSYTRPRMSLARFSLSPRPMPPIKSINSPSRCLSIPGRA